LEKSADGITVTVPENRALVPSAGEAHPHQAGGPADLALVILVGAYVTASATDRKGLAERVAALWGAVPAASRDEGQAGP
ncbi:hypothetical protein AB0D13_34515, partial [Streptomyces sp. NPDC048430]|uniref:hypothetical protein n=1 Tax=Streptomyces sp. NPDC048430 TaxID=3155388 RepID=UPI00344A74D4